MLQVICAVSGDSPARLALLSRVEGDSVQLKLQRSQRAGGLLGNTVVFCLDVRADYSPAESANISKYKLGKELIYSSQAARRHLDNMGKHLDRVESESLAEKASGVGRGIVSLALAKMNLNVSIASLGRGHHIECKDLPELLAAEETIMEACRRLKQYLAAAATFSGTVTLIDFDDEEKAHISHGALELLSLPAPSTTPSTDARSGQIAVRTAPPLQFTSLQDFWQSLYARARTLAPATLNVLLVAVPAAAFLFLLFVFLALTAG